MTQEQETPDGPAQPDVAAPTPARSVPQQAQVTVDVMPEDRAALARMTPEERSAIYLNSIRKMMVFFVVLAVIGIIAGVIIGIIDINTLKITSSSASGF